MRLLPRLLALAPLALAAAATAPAPRPAPGDGLVRVRLLEGYRPARVALTADTDLAVYADGAATPALRLDAGTTLRLAVDAGRATATADGRTATGLALRVAARAGDPIGGRFTLRVEAGQPLNPARRYEGDLTVTPDGARPGLLRLVHAVDLDRYVAGVVQREYGMDDLEGSKAMAVAARTYALRVKGRYGRDYDVVDHVGSQVYYGTEGVRRNARQAADETSGEVLTYEGRLAETVYSASSGGHTAANEAIWGTAPVAYLRARPDPYDARLSPHARWTFRLDADGLHAALGRTFGGPVRGVRVAERTAEGRARRLTLDAEGGPKTVPVGAFQRAVTAANGALSLRSSFFDVRREGDLYVFDGHGYGHGVGLSQWGARAQALDGRSYRDILAFYYPGTALRTADGLDRFPTLLASAELPDLDDLLPPEPESLPSNRAEAPPAAARPPRPATDRPGADRPTTPGPDAVPSTVDDAAADEALRVLRPNGWGAPVTAPRPRETPPTAGRAEPRRAEAPALRREPRTAVSERAGDWVATPAAAPPATRRTGW